MMAMVLMSAYMVRSRSYAVGDIDVVIHSDIVSDEGFLDNRASKCKASAKRSHDGGRTHDD